ncbi:MAG: tRNA (N6-isopentenyl adenosine(37)-C2)-methylthiotransferase MiaB [Spirochaetales bacterium]
MKKHYKIVTYGCQMNVHESEKLAGMLESLEYENTEDNEQADIIVFNTCTIREGAVDRAFGNIGALKKLKAKKKDLIIAVGGCMTQNKIDADRLKHTFPFVDIIFGTHNLHKFKQYVIDFELNKERILTIWDDEGIVPPMTEIDRTSGLNAWVNISFGCNNYCSYCIVPYVRGRERSRQMDEIVAECKALIKDGYKIITLLGQNVNSYGNDIEDSSVTFANLLKQISSLEGDFRLTFMTSHPKDLKDEVIDVIASSPKIIKAVHLPVQSGSNTILKAMNRRYTVEHYLTIIDKLRRAIPDIALSSDFIVGFPGETEEDFEATKNLVKTVGYDFIFAYIYSKRTGTSASTMQNQVPYSIKNRRVNELLKLQKEISAETLKKFIGKEYEILIDEQKNNKFYGRIPSGRLVELDENNLKVGTFKTIKILDINSKKITGKTLN